MLNHSRDRGPRTHRSRAATVLAAVAIVVPLAAGGVAPPTGVTAQQAAALSGTMLDQTGGALPGVRVTLADTESDVQYVTGTDGNGRFAFRDLQPARYELVASLAGFATVADVIALGPGATVARPLYLPLGTLEETVTVGCSARPVATAAPLARHSVAVHVTPAEANLLSTRLRQAWNRARQAIVPVLSAQQNGAGVPVRVGGNVRLPKKLTNVNPVCPKTAIPATDTIVSLVGRIGVDGFMNEVTAEPGAAPPAEFTASALDAVRLWTFTPTLLNGQPAEVGITIHVLYRRM